MSRLFERENSVLRIRGSWSTFTALAVCLSASVAAQVVVRSPAPIRDAPRPQPGGRQIPVGTSAISGTVTATDTGGPVSGARVGINGQTTCTGFCPPAQIESMYLSRIVVTDELGQFSFPRLPAGVFRISVYPHQNQFLETSYGQRRPGGQGQAIQVGDGQKITLQVPVLRGAVITGVVRGPDGQPQRHVQIRALRHDMSSGFRRLQAFNHAQTDDRGAYRLFGLQPGDYIVAATPNGMPTGAEVDLVERAILSAPVTPPRAAGMPATIALPATTNSHDYTPSFYLPTYAPAAMTPSDATTITVTGSEERTGIDIGVRFVKAGTIKGVISTPLEAGVRVQLWLLSDDPSFESPHGNQTQASGDGSFVFRAVAPGTYTVLAQTLPAPRPNPYVNGQPAPPQPPPILADSQKMWGKALVTVSSDATVSPAVQLQATRSISGIVIFDMKQPPDLTRNRMTVTANPAPSPQQVYFAQLEGVMGTDGRFTISGVPAGRYTIRLNGGYLKSSVISGQDTLDFPLDFSGDRDVTDAVLTVTDRLGGLEGTLTDAMGKPALDYTIVAAATDTRYWGPGSRRVKSTGLSVEGKYDFGALPPGSYQISVVVDPQYGALSDPEFLRAIAATSIPITIMDGIKATQNLRVK